MRGQAEAVGAIVIAMLILAGLLAYSLAIRSASRQVQESSELAQLEVARRAEELYFYANATGIYARSTTGSTVVYAAAYSESGVIYESRLPVHVSLNWTLLVANTTIASLVKSGGAHLVAVTDRGNVFAWDPAGELAQVREELGNAVNTPFWVVERVPATATGGPREGNYVLYRTRRLVLPETSIYLYALPASGATLVAGAWEILRGFPVYINSTPAGSRYVYVVVSAATYRVLNGTALVDLNDDTLGIDISTSPGTSALYMCVDLGEQRTGWFYINVEGYYNGGTTRAWTVNASSRPCNEDDPGAQPVAVLGWNYQQRVQGVWFTTARSIRANATFWSGWIRVYSVEFYPLTASSFTYSGDQPTVELVSVFALPYTHLQVLEVVWVKPPG